MEVIEIKDKKLWNDFLIANDGDFLQSWQRGELQERLGRKIFRLGVREGELKAAVLIIKYELPLGKSYLYCGRGPVINNFQFSIFNFQTIFNLLIKEIKNIAEKENAIFLRVDPDILSNNKEAENFFQEAGFLKSKNNNTSVSQPALSWRLNLGAPEDEIFAQMKEKTRYNIRLATKKGVKVRESQNREDFEKFYLLSGETAKRDDFQLHPKKHYQEIFKILKEDNLSSLFLAEHEGDLLTAIFVSFFNQRAFYLYGASSDQKKNLMASQLTQWIAIKEAKNRGCLTYDFGGITLSDNPRHPWQGLTRFKKSFGGEGVEYLSAYDLVFQPFWYYGTVAGYRIWHKILNFCKFFHPAHNKYLFRQF